MLSALCAVAFGFQQRHSPDEAFVPAPNTFATKQQIAGWVKAHQGYSGDFIGVKEFAFRGSQIYVTWVSPFSGRAADQTWVYRTRADAKWHLIDTHLYEGFLKEVRLDQKRAKLIFVSPANDRRRLKVRELALSQ